MDGGQLDVSAGGVFAIEPLDGIKRHEEMDTQRARALLERIALSGVWTHPLLVEAETGILLDGHHRYWCAQRLGFDWIPTFRIAYADENLEVLSWRPDYPVTREVVIEAGVSGHLLPKKTSRHLYSGHLPGCAIPLDVLKRRQAA